MLKIAHSLHAGYPHKYWYWSPSFVPIAVAEHTITAIDLAGAATGKVGQVVLVSTEVPGSAVYFPALGNYLAWLAELAGSGALLESGSSAQVAISAQERLGGAVVDLTPMDVQPARDWSHHFRT